jgi:antitoxin (DNA-binding transcriptional repressor) of toxin-antitoxin stability system
MATVNVRSLKDDLSAWIRRAELGERVVVLRDGAPVATIVPYDASVERDEEAIVAEMIAAGEATRGAIRSGRRPRLEPYVVPDELRESIADARGAARY